MELNSCKDITIQSVSSASDILAAISNLVSKLPDKKPLIGLCGGGSILPVLESLRELAEINNETVLNAHYLLADERIVPIDSPESNAKLILDKLIIPLNAKDISLSFTPFQTGDTSAGAAEYTQIINKHGSFDVVFLGMGPDSHIASIFPNGAWQEIDNKSPVFFEINSPKPPAERVSLTPRTITEAKLVVLLFFGSAKSIPLDNFLRNTTKPKETPITLTHNTEHILALVDADCLSASLEASRFIK